MFECTFPTCDIFPFAVEADLADHTSEEHGQATAGDIARLKREARQRDKEAAQSYGYSGTSSNYRTHDLRSKPSQGEYSLGAILFALVFAIVVTVASLVGAL